MDKRKKTAPAAPKVPPLPVVVVGYDFDDQAVDQLIALTFRIFERFASQPGHMKKLLVLAQLAQQFG